VTLTLADGEGSSALARFADLPTTPSIQTSTAAPVKWSGWAAESANGKAAEVEAGAAAPIKSGCWC
jgi:hypothetical protein